MPEQETLRVPMLSSGIILELEPERQAIKDATDEELGRWFAAYYKPVIETFNMVKEELLGRMEKSGQSLLPLGNGQEIKVEKTPKRTVMEAGMRGVQKKILDQFGADIQLVRVKTEVLPDMRGIKKAYKLGDDVKAEIDAFLIEEPGRPRLKVEGLTDAQREKVFGVADED